MTGLRSKLREWGRWARGDGGQGFSAESIIFRAMYLGCASFGIPWRSGGLDELADVIDLERAITGLPPECVRVLVSEYVEGGTCRARFHATGFPRTTYYRTLDKAHQALMSRFDTLEGCSPSAEF